MKGISPLILYTRKLSILNNLPTFRLPSFPERLKGTFTEKWWQYWKNVAHDYTDVAVDVARQVRDKPWKGVAAVGLSGNAVLCAKMNPDEIHFRDSFVNISNSFIFVGSSIRNPVAREHLHFIERCFNEGVIRRLSFGVFSVIWVDDYDRAVSQYKAQCTYLKPDLFSFHRRILDIGFLNKWWIMNRKMIDWDINPSEWGLEGRTKVKS